MNFVPYFAWAGAEIAVAIFCVGIPTLRPLYLRARGKTSTYASHGRSNASDLPQFTMLKDKPNASPSIPESALSTPSRMEAGLSKPANVYTRPTSDKDISEEKMGPGHRAGVIWVQSEIRVREDDAEWPLTTSKPSSFI